MRPPLEAADLPLAAAPLPRARLVARARLLAWLSLGWHVLESVVAVVAGVAAGSIALLGFGADSVAEALAAGVVVWRFGRGREASEAAERSAQRLIALTFLAIGVAVAGEAVRALVTGDHPGESVPGIVLGALTLAAMPPLAAAKTRVGKRLGSAATRGEGRQNMLCAYLSAALLVGLGANALAGLWWADPVAALVIAAVAFGEGRTAWRGDGCCADPACGC